MLNFIRRINYYPALAMIYISVIGIKINFRSRIYHSAEHDSYQKQIHIFMFRFVCDGKRGDVRPSG